MCICFSKVRLTILLVVSFLLLPLTVTNAELRLTDTNENGYKTYFDTDSLNTEANNSILLVRVVGYRPDGSVIRDNIDRFKRDGADVYCSHDGISWMNINKSSTLKMTYTAIRDYVKEMVETSERVSSKTGGKPTQDTWVMAFGLCDYYVKSGSLEQIGSYHPDVAPSFRVKIITILSENPQETSTDVYEFIAKGDVKVSVNGKYRSMISQDRFTRQLYDAIVAKFY